MSFFESESRVVDEIETSIFWDSQDSEIIEFPKQSTYKTSQVFLSDDEVQQDHEDFDYVGEGDFDLFLLLDQLHQVEGTELEEGMIPPIGYSLVLSEIILRQLKTADILPNRITLSAEGGYCFVFKNNVSNIYLEIYNDGEIGLIAEDCIRRKIIINKEIPIQDVNSSIKNLLIGE